MNMYHAGWLQRLSKQQMYDSSHATKEELLRSDFVMHCIWVLHSSLGIVTPVWLMTFCWLA